MTNAEFVRDLRALADWYELNPQAPLPLYPVINIFADFDPGKAKQQFRQFGEFAKQYQGEWFVARKEFGSLRLELSTQREKVCRRVVVGTREIPEHIIPAQPESIVPAHTEEIHEWRCDPILAEEDNYPKGIEGLSSPPSEAEVEL